MGRGDNTEQPQPTLRRADDLTEQQRVFSDPHLHLKRLRAKRTLRYHTDQAINKQLFLTDERIQAQLEEIVDVHSGFFPTRQQFKDAGQLRLYQLLKKQDRLQHWANEFGVQLKTRGYSDADIERKLSSLIADGAQYFPSWNDMVDAGMEGLARHLSKSGDKDKWAERFSVQLRAQGGQVAWTDKRIEQGLRAVLGQNKQIPPRSQFIAAGYEGLYNHLISEQLFQQWADRLDVEPPAYGKGKWNDERIERELRAYATDGYFPTQKQFVADGRQGLLMAIKHNGGARVWSERLGLKARSQGGLGVKKSKRDPLSIERELKEVCAELGHFPSGEELKARGNNKLSAAMRRAGGVNHWRERMGYPPIERWTRQQRIERLQQMSVNGKLPSRQQIIATMGENFANSMYSRGRRWWAEQAGLSE